MSLHNLLLLPCFSAVGGNLNWGQLAITCKCCTTLFDKPHNILWKKHLLQSVGCDYGIICHIYPNLGIWGWSLGYSTQCPECSSGIFWKIYPCTLINTHASFPPWIRRWLQWAHGLYMPVYPNLGFWGGVWGSLPSFRNAARAVFGSPTHVLQEAHMHPSPLHGLDRHLQWTHGLFPISLSVYVY